MAAQSPARWLSCYFFWKSMGNTGIVGVFDSGIGGITVLSELVQFLPEYSFIYFADTENCPYGSKSQTEIIHLSHKIVEFLIQKGAEVVVVACNTATASAIDYLRENFRIPFVGMEPAIKPAALATKTKSVGVLATAGTFNGRLYKETSKKYAGNIKVNYQIGEGLVELVEQQQSRSPKAKKLLEKYIKPMLDDDIDHLVLGCTHYPFFIPLLKNILPKSVAIINPAPAVAKQARRIVQKTICPNEHLESSIDFFSSGDIKILQQIVLEEGLFESPLKYNTNFSGNVSLR